MGYCLFPSFFSYWTDTIKICNFVFSLIINKVFGLLFTINLSNRFTYIINNSLFVVVSLHCFLLLFPVRTWDTLFFVIGTFIRKHTQHVHSKNSLLFFPKWFFIFIFLSDVYLYLPFSSFFSVKIIDRWTTIDDRAHLSLTIYLSISSTTIWDFLIIIRVSLCLLLTSACTISIKNNCLFLVRYINFHHQFLLFPRLFTKFNITWYL